MMRDLKIFSVSSLISSTAVESEDSPLNRQVVINRPCSIRHFPRVLSPSSGGSRSRQRDIERRADNRAMFQLKAAIKLCRLEAPVRGPAQSKRQLRKRGALVLLRDVGKNLLVVPARVLFLSFPKWYVVGDAVDSSVSFRI